MAFTIQDDLSVNNAIIGIITADGSKGTLGQVLSSNGTSLYWSSAAAGLPGGTEGEIQFYDGADFGANTNLYWDKANARLGIATKSPTVDLHVAGDVRFDGTFYAGGILGTSNQALSSDGGGGIYWRDIPFVSTTIDGADGRVAIFSGTDTLKSDTALVFNATSDRLGIACTTPAYTLDVGGDVQVSGGIVAGATFGISGQVLKSTGTGIQWDTVAGTGTVTSIASGSGLTGAAITNSGTLNVGAGDGITVSADAVAVDGANGILVTTVGVNVQAANSTISVTTGGVAVDETQLNITAGQVSGLTYYTDSDVETYITGGAGITYSAGTIDVNSANGLVITSGTLNVLAGNNYITSNTTGVWYTGPVGGGSSVTAANGIVEIATGFNVLAGNTQLISNSTGLWLDQSKISIIEGQISDLTPHYTTLNANTDIDARVTKAFIDVRDIDANTFALRNSEYYLDYTNFTNTPTARTAANGLFLDTNAYNVDVGNTQLVSNTTGLWVDSSQINTSALNNDALFSTYTTSDFTTDFGAETTTNLSEGTNEYYTILRANTAFDARLATSSTTDLSEGTNLYYTILRANNAIDARVDTVYIDAQTPSYGALTGTPIARTAANGLFLDTDAYNIHVGNTQLISNTTGLWVDQTQLIITESQISDISAHYTSGNFDTDFGTKTTSDLTQGSNLYYTTLQANTDFDARLATSTTTDLAEGTNLYYLDSRVDSRLVGGAGIDYTTGTIDVAVANGVQIISDSVGAKVANGLFLTTDGINVLAGNTYITSNTTGVWYTGPVGGSSVTAANGIVEIATGFNVLAGNNYITSNTTGVWYTGPVGGDAINIDGGDATTVFTAANIIIDGGTAVS
jgi:hypothetical protein